MTETLVRHCFQNFTANQVSKHFVYGINHYCKFGGNTFIISLQLNIHMGIHNGETPHECNICKKRNLIGKMILNWGLNITNEDGWWCSICALGHLAELTEITLIVLRGSNRTRMNSLLWDS